MFTVPEVARFTIHGSFVGGRPTANIIDIALDPTGPSRAQACEAVSGVILASFEANIRPHLTDGWSADRVSWLDLDNAEGSTGSRNQNGATQWPTVGGVVGDDFAVNTAILVRKTIIGHRGKRAGRMYLPGVAETMSNNGHDLPAATRDLWQDRFDLFFSDLVGPTSTPEGEVDHVPVVVHVTQWDHSDPNRPKPLVGQATNILAYEVQTRFATQRRRLRR